MKELFQSLRFALLAALAIGFTASAARADVWKGSATGTTTPTGLVDVDYIKGQQTPLGQFIGAGYHVLNTVDFTFEGHATWYGNNGNVLFVTYTGQVFPSGDPDFPYGFIAELKATGGTGKMRGARGQAVMTGAFTGIPGELYLDFEGTIQIPH